MESTDLLVAMASLVVGFGLGFGTCIGLFAYFARVVKEDERSRK